MFFVALLVTLRGVSCFTKWQYVRLNRITTYLQSVSLQETAVDLSTDLEAFKNGYKTCEKEICEAITTSLPDDIQGTYFRSVDCCIFLLTT